MSWFKFCETLPKLNVQYEEQIAIFIILIMATFPLCNRFKIILYNDIDIAKLRLSEVSTFLGRYFLLNKFNFQKSVAKDQRQ